MLFWILVYFFSRWLPFDSTPFIGLFIFDLRGYLYLRPTPYMYSVSFWTLFSFSLVYIYVRANVILYIFDILKYSLMFGRVGLPSPLIITTTPNPARFLSIVFSLSLAMKIRISLSSLKQIKRTLLKFCSG